MGETIRYFESRNRNQFNIDYPYYGLFGSAQITPIEMSDECLYQCRLLNGNVICIKKQAQAKKWIDTELNQETPLSAVIGRSIEDFLKKAV